MCLVISNFSKRVDKDGGRNRGSDIIDRRTERRKSVQHRATGAQNTREVEFFLRK